MSVGFHASVLPYGATSFAHSDNIYGNPSSLSDARLTTNSTLVTGDQCLATLSQIEPQTYDRDDLGERRLGLLADQCEDALRAGGLVSIDNVIGERHWQVESATDVYKTLQYDRLAPLLIGAVNMLSARAQALESPASRKKRNGPTASQPL